MLGRVDKFGGVGRGTMCGTMWGGPWYNVGYNVGRGTMWAGTLWYNAVQGN